MFNYPNDLTILPIVTYYEAAQSSPGQGYWDNSSHAGDTSIVFDVWTAINSSTTALVKAIDAVMQANLFNIDDSRDVPEPNAKIQHRTMRYSRTVTASDLA